MEIAPQYFQLYGGILYYITKIYTLHTINTFLYVQQQKPFKTFQEYSFILEDTFQ